MKHYLSAEDIAALDERKHVHQFNDNAVRMTRSVGELLGLTRLGVNLIRLESGRDSTTHHYHDADEEFIYILSGKGLAKIGDETTAVGPGDFMAFTAPSAAHSLHNPNAEDLVYLVGGESNYPDVVHYPDIDRIMLKTGGKKSWFPAEQLTEVISPTPPKPD